TRLKSKIPNLGEAPLPEVLRRSDADKVIERLVYLTELIKRDWKLTIKWRTMEGDCERIRTAFKYINQIGNNQQALNLLTYNPLIIYFLKHQRQEYDGIELVIKILTELDYGFDTKEVDIEGKKQYLIAVNAVKRFLRTSPLWLGYLTTIRIKEFHEQIYLSSASPYGEPLLRVKSGWFGGPCGLGVTNEAGRMDSDAQRDTKAALENNIHGEYSDLPKKTRDVIETKRPDLERRLRKENVTILLFEDGVDGRAPPHIWRDSETRFLLAYSENKQKHFPYGLIIDLVAHDRFDLLERLIDHEDDRLDGVKSLSELDDQSQTLARDIVKALGALCGWGRFSHKVNQHLKKNAALFRYVYEKFSASLCESQERWNRTRAVEEVEGILASIREDANITYEDVALNPLLRKFSDDQRFIRELLALVDRNRIIPHRDGIMPNALHVAGPLCEQIESDAILKIGSYKVKINGDGVTTLSRPHDHYGSVAYFLEDRYIGANNKIFNAMAMVNHSPRGRTRYSSELINLAENFHIKHGRYPGSLDLKRLFQMTNRVELFELMPECIFWTPVNLRLRAWAEIITMREFGVPCEEVDFSLTGDNSEEIIQRIIFKLVQRDYLLEHLDWSEIECFEEKVVPLAHQNMDALQNVVNLALGVSRDIFWAICRKAKTINELEEELLENQGTADHTRFGEYLSAKICAIKILPTEKQQTFVNLLNLCDIQGNYIRLLGAQTNFLDERFNEYAGDIFVYQTGSGIHNGYRYWHAVTRQEAEQLLKKNPRLKIYPILDAPVDHNDWVGDRIDDVLVEAKVSVEICPGKYPIVLLRDSLEGVFISQEQLFQRLKAKGVTPKVSRSLLTAVKRFAQSRKMQPLLPVLTLGLSSFFLMGAAGSDLQLQQTKELLVIVGIVLGLIGIFPFCDWVSKSLRSLWDKFRFKRYVRQFRKGNKNERMGAIRSLASCGDDCQHAAIDFLLEGLSNFDWEIHETVVRSLLRQMHEKFILTLRAEKALVDSCSRERMLESIADYEDRLTKSYMNAFRGVDPEDCLRIVGRLKSLAVASKDPMRNSLAVYRAATNAYQIIFNQDQGRAPRPRIRHILQPNPVDLPKGTRSRVSKLPLIFSAFLSMGAAAGDLLWPFALVAVSILLVISHRAIRLINARREDKLSLERAMLFGVVSLDEFPRMKVTINSSGDPLSRPQVIGGEGVDANPGNFNIANGLVRRFLAYCSDYMGKSRYSPSFDNLTITFCPKLPASIEEKEMLFHHFIGIPQEGELYIPYPNLVKGDTLSMLSLALSQNCLVQTVSKALNEPIEETIMRFFTAGIGIDDVLGTYMNLGKAKDILEFAELRQAASQIYVYEDSPHQWHAVTRQEAKQLLKDNPNLKIYSILDAPVDHNDWVGGKGVVKSRVKPATFDGVPNIIEDMTFEQFCLYDGVIRVTLRLTESCNLQCSYCSLESGPGGARKEIPLEKLAEIIPALDRVGVRRLDLSGGEPFIRKDIFNIIELASNTALSLGVITNGTLIKPEIAQKLNRYPVHSIKVSLDGDRKTNDAIRGKGSFDRAINGLKYLMEKTDIKVKVLLTLTKSNGSGVAGLARLLSDLGVWRFAIRRVDPLGRADMSFIPGDDDVWKVYRDLLKISGTLRKHFIEWEFQNPYPHIDVWADNPYSFVEASGRHATFLPTGEIKIDFDCDEVVGSWLEEVNIVSVFEEIKRRVRRQNTSFNPVQARFVILAGGCGVTLWPLSTKATPKQLLKCGQEYANGIQELITNLEERVDPKQIIIQTVQDYEEEIIFTAESLHVPKDNIFVEPQSVGTAMAVAYTALRLYEKNRSIPIVIVPPDHIIEPLDEFWKALMNAIELARKSSAIVCIGINPDRPDTHYGYIKEGNAEEYVGVAHVKGFIEKPSSVEEAKRLIGQGYKWNSAVYVFTPEAILNCFCDLIPECYAKLKQALSINVENKNRVVDQIFAQFANYGLFDGNSLEHLILGPLSQNPEASVDLISLTGVNFASIDTGDLGCGMRYANKNRVGENNNLVLIPDSVFVKITNTQNCNVAVQGDVVREVVIDGVDNLIVATSARSNSVLVIPIGRAKDVKSIHKILAGRQEFLPYIKGVFKGERCRAFTFRHDCGNVELFSDSGLVVAVGLNNVKVALKNKILSVLKITGSDPERGKPSHPGPCGLGVTNAAGHMDSDAQRDTKAALENNIHGEYSDLPEDIQEAIEDENLKIAANLRKQNVVILFSKDGLGQRAPPYIWCDSETRFLLAYSENEQKHFPFGLIIDLVSYGRFDLLERLINHEDDRLLSRKSLPDLKIQSEELARDIVKALGALFGRGDVVKSRLDPIVLPLSDYFNSPSSFAFAGETLDALIKELNLAQMVEGSEVILLVHPYIALSYANSYPSGGTTDTEYYDNYLRGLKGLFRCDKKTTFVCLVCEDEFGFVIVNSGGFPRTVYREGRHMTLFGEFLDDIQGQINPEHTFIIVPTFPESPTIIINKEQGYSHRTSWGVFVGFLRRLFLSTKQEKLAIAGEFYSFSICGFPLGGCLGKILKELKSAHDLGVELEFLPGLLVSGRRMRDQDISLDIELPEVAMRSDADKAIRRLIVLADAIRKGLFGKKDYLMDCTSKEISKACDCISQIGSNQQALNLLVYNPFIDCLLSDGSRDFYGVDLALKILTGINYNRDVRTTTIKGEKQYLITLDAVKRSLNESDLWTIHLNDVHLKEREGIMDVDGSFGPCGLGVTNEAGHMDADAQRNTKVALQNNIHGEYGDLPQKTRDIIEDRAPALADRLKESNVVILFPENGINGRAPPHIWRDSETRFLLAYSENEQKHFPYGLIIDLVSYGRFDLLERLIDHEDDRLDGTKSLPDLKIQSEELAREINNLLLYIEDIGNFFLDKGYLIDPYPINNGEFAFVYRATRVEDQKVFAIKATKQDLSEILYNYDKEKYVSGKQSGVSIKELKGFVTIYEEGVILSIFVRNSPPYIETYSYQIMEFLEGNSLYNLYQGNFFKTINIAQLIDELIEVANNVAVLHKQGVAHGDIKLGNMMRDLQGIVVSDRTERMESITNYCMCCEMGPFAREHLINVYGIYSLRAHDKYQIYICILRLLKQAALSADAESMIDDFNQVWCGKCTNYNFVDLIAALIELKSRLNRGKYGDLSKCGWGRFSHKVNQHLKKNAALFRHVYEKFSGALCKSQERWNRTRAVEEVENICGNIKDRNLNVLLEGFSTQEEFIEQFLALVTMNILVPDEEGPLAGVLDNVSGPLCGEVEPNFTKHIDHCKLDSFGGFDCLRRDRKESSNFAFLEDCFIGLDGETFNLKAMVFKGNLPIYSLDYFQWEEMRYFEWLIQLAENYRIRYGKYLELKEFFEDRNRDKLRICLPRYTSSIMDQLRVWGEVEAMRVFGVPLWEIDFNLSGGNKELIRRSIFKLIQRTQVGKTHCNYNDFQDVIDLVEEDPNVFSRIVNLALGVSSHSFLLLHGRLTTVAALKDTLLAYQGFVGRTTIGERLFYKSCVVGLLPYEKRQTFINLFALSDIQGNYIRLLGAQTNFLDERFNEYAGDIFVYQTSSGIHNGYRYWHAVTREDAERLLKEISGLKIYPILKAPADACDWVGGSDSIPVDLILAKNKKAFRVSACAEFDASIKRVSSKDGLRDWQMEEIIRFKKTIRRLYQDENGVYGAKNNSMTSKQRNHLASSILQKNSFLSFVSWQEDAKILKWRHYSVYVRIAGYDFRLDVTDDYGIVIVLQEEINKQPDFWYMYPKTNPPAQEGSIFDGALERYVHIEQGGFLERYYKIVAEVANKILDDKDWKELLSFDNLIPVFKQIGISTIYDDPALEVYHLLKEHKFCVEYRNGSDQSYIAVKLAQRYFILDVNRLRTNGAGIVLIPEGLALGFCEGLGFSEIKAYDPDYPSAGGMRGSTVTELNLKNRKRSFSGSCGFGVANDDGMMSAITKARTEKKLKSGYHGRYGDLPKKTRDAIETYNATLMGKLKEDNVVIFTSQDGINSREGQFIWFDFKDYFLIAYCDGKHIYIPQGLIVALAANNQLDLLEEIINHERKRLEPGADPKQLATDSEALAQEVLQVLGAVSDARNWDRAEKKILSKSKAEVLSKAEDSFGAANQTWFMIKAAGIFFNSVIIGKNIEINSPQVRELTQEYVSFINRTPKISYIFDGDISFEGVLRMLKFWYR
ncbi:MAG: radical SAM protein, partial [Candidatus Omnitrophica bacterium]|nr:radical SAM protein [Candidatus Omnitrophota bacterium]